MDMFLVFNHVFNVVMVKCITDSNSIVIPNNFVNLGIGLNKIMLVDYVQVI